MGKLSIIKRGEELKKILQIIFCVFLCCFFSACSSNAPKQTATNSNHEKSDLLEQQWEDDIRYDESQNSSSNSDFIKEIEVSKKFTQILKNGKVYIYDSNGNSLIASKEKKYDNFSKLTKKDCHNILGSNLSGFKLLDFNKTSIIGKNAIRIKFESSKNDEKFLNLCYYLDCDNNGIKIMIQAKTDKILKELEETIDTIKLN